MTNTDKFIEYCRFKNKEMNGVFIYAKFELWCNAFVKDKTDFNLFVKFCTDNHILLTQKQFDWIVKNKFGKE